MWFTACRLWLQRAWTWEEADYPSLIRQGKCYGSFISVLPGQGTGPSCFPQHYLKGCRQPTKVSTYVLQTSLMLGINLACIDRCKLRGTRLFLALSMALSFLISKAGSCDELWQLSGSSWIPGHAGRWEERHSFAVLPCFSQNACGAQDQVQTSLPFSPSTS